MLYYYCIDTSCHTPYDCDVVILCCCITFDFRIRWEGCKSYLLPICEAIGAIGDVNELIQPSLA